MRSIRAQQNQYRSTTTGHHRSILPHHHRSTLPLHRQSTLDAYQSIRSSMCVEILGMEKPPRDQTTLGGKKRRNWKKRKRIMGDSQLSLIPCFSYGVRKSRVRSICFSQPFAKLQALLIAEMIDKGEESMKEAFTQE
ncbi:hypothetical protein F2Q69_00022277 [Brassica cretica]|uniref:Uncharacterized protein n=1 Tax=Brassica cretica TaxID=69181 RepID=A0A8S9QJK0_BRACR|nr:hypothetical protein F2Q69_00022277 [Brassica cretica]